MQPWLSEAAYRSPLLLNAAYGRAEAPLQAVRSVRGRASAPTASAAGDCHAVFHRAFTVPSHAVAATFLPSKPWLGFIEYPTLRTPSPQPTVLLLGP
jgi:hypothetical protein